MKKFISKKGREILIRKPTKTDVQEVWRFFNRLVEEDTYILRYGKKVSLREEGLWLKNMLNKMSKKEVILLQAYFEERLVGQVEITKKEYRKRFNGTLHIGVDRNLRSEGIGEELMKQVETEAKKIGLKLIDLIVFGGNDPASRLYKKLGYKEFGRLPNSVEFRGQMLDEVHMYKRL
jgi:ribosomal protein S18 acetylase RimI-like enzyme